MAAAECSGMGRQLCTQKQLLTGIHMGPTGLTSWLLFDSEGRGPLLAKAKKCKVSESSLIVARRMRPAFFGGI